MNGERNVQIVHDNISINRRVNNKVIKMIIFMLENKRNISYFSTPVKNK